jgi:hypothetical protein
MVVAFVGGARRERGAGCIPDVVKICLPMNIRFFIQAKNESDSIAQAQREIEKLRERAATCAHEFCSKNGPRRLCGCY